MNALCYYKYFIIIIIDVVVVVVVTQVNIISPINKMISSNEGEFKEEKLLTFRFDLKFQRFLFDKNI